jgi:tetratricopeptide (TPR) repeat protein
MKILICIILLLAGTALRAQYIYTENCVRAHKMVTALRFDEARELIGTEKTSDPDNLVPLLLENYIDFLTLIVGEDQRVFDSLVKQRPVRLKMLAAGDQSSPWYRASIARVNMQWAFARVKSGQYLTAALEIRKAYRLLEENNREYPGFPPDQVGLGLMHALIGSIPDNQQWIADIFSMQGSISQGREELLNVLENAGSNGFSYLHDEALFFLSFIDLNLQADRNNADALLPVYDNTDSDNLLLVFSKARILMQCGMNDEAITLLTHSPRGKEYFPFYYLDYLAGLAKLNRLDEDAGNYLLRFLVNFRGKNYVKSGYQKLAWHHLLQGDENRYREYIGKALLYGDEMTDGDKLARAEAESGIIPNVCLLKARLLFDGGYFASAANILQQHDCSLISARDSIEFLYRNGRIAHAMGLHREALSWYGKTIDAGLDKTWYFAANAALLSGNILESEGDFEGAGIHYRLASRMKNKEYSTSIKQKAKAGINRIEEAGKADK